MSYLLQFVMHSQILHSLLSYAAFSALVDGMPAPTKDSGIAYQWTFRSLNLFAANPFRAKGTRIESSPNFQDALDIQTDKAGLPRIDVKEK
jgi:hypothetical protein